MIGHNWDLGVSSLKGQYSACDLILIIGVFVVTPGENAQLARYLGTLGAKLSAALDEPSGPHSLSHLAPPSQSWISRKSRHECSFPAQ